MTARQLADELEVSERTIYRDIESLGVAGVPVYGDRGPAGGYQLLDGYRTRLTGLTTDEAESLFLAGAPGPAADLGLGAVLATAQLKLMAALPPELRTRAGRIQERFLLDAPGWYQQAERPEHLGTVADAVWNQRSVWVRYRSWAGEVTRELDPMGVVLKGGSWYLVGRLAQYVNAYRVARILELKTLDRHFERPPEFELGKFWFEYQERFLQALYKHEMVLRLSPRGFAGIAGSLGRVPAEAASRTADEPDERGWVRVLVPYESLDHAKEELLAMGVEVEVEEPPELRAAMEETVRALSLIYR